MLPRLLATVATLLIISNAQANWPQFRRDGARSGDNPQAKLTLPMTQIVAVKMPAPIYASPAVVDGKIFILDARGNVICVNGDTNEVVWSLGLGGFNNSSSPAVANNKVYVGSAQGGLYILDALSGKKLNHIAPEHPVIAAPALADDGGVYFSTFTGKLFKIDADGKVLWSFSGGRLSYTEIAVRGKTLLFFAGSTNTQLYWLQDQGNDAKVLQKQSAPSACCPMSGPAFVDDDHFAFQAFDSEFGRFHLMNQEGKGPASVDINDSRIVPAFRDGVLYRGDKAYSRDGLKVLWRADPQELYDGGFHSSPALTGEHLVVGCERGMLHVFDLNGGGKSRKSAWKFQVPTAGQPNSAISSSPAVVGDRIYFGGEDGVLYGLGQGKAASVVTAKILHEQPIAKREILNGSEWPTPGGDMGYSYISQDKLVKPPFEIAWKSRIWSVFKAPMIVADSRVFCAGRLGNFTALDAATGEILWKTHHPGVESRPAPTYIDGKLLLMRSRNNQGDSPYVSGASGGPGGEGLYCHDAVTGKQLWHQPMPFKYHFNHDGLVAHEGKVFTIQVGKMGQIDGVALSLDSGKELWRRPLEGLREPVKSVLKLPPRFGSVLAGGLWVVSVSDRGTLGVDPKDGKTVWIDSEHFLTNRSRIGARGDTVIVFAEDGDYAIDAKTGGTLWKGAAPSSRYSQALTDRYLKSEGKEGYYPTAVCAWPIYANGHWYSHASYATQHGSNKLACMKEPADKKVGALNEKMIVWSYEFLSNACPAPSPAYGRLYYSPASEGVIYSFRPK